MQKKKILLIGGGGHCRSVLDTLLQSNTYADIGIIDKKSGEILGIPILGNDDVLFTLREQGWSHAFITLGSVGDTSVRHKIYHTICNLGFEIPNIIDPTAVIAKDSRLRHGIYIGKRAVVNANSSLEECVIVNTGAIVEHDCRVGAFSHISPGAILCGGVSVGEDVHIGAGTSIKQQIKIGDTSIIGMGSNVVKDIPAGKVAYGNPCKVVKRV